MTDQNATAAAEAEIAAAIASADTASEPLPRPRIRTGAVIWGLLLVALGSWALWVAGSPQRREDALHALLGLQPFDWAVIGLIAVGGFVTLIALAAVIRRMQHRMAGAAR